jgi:PEGA domain-containing protein
MCSSFIRRGSSAALLVTMSLGLSVATLAQDTGTLRTRVTPGVAGVFVDDKYMGTVAQFKSSSAALVLPVGQHKVELVDPRYEPYSTTVNIQAGRTEIVRQALTKKTLARPPFGKLKVKGAVRAAVYINNQYYGQSDEFNGPGQELLLPPGEYNLRVVPQSGGSPKEEKITITAKRSTTINM